MARIDLQYSADALADLDSIFSYIVHTSGFARNARSFTDDILARCDILSDYPEAGKSRPDLGDNVRQISFDRVVIIYRYDKLELVIARIFYGGQDYETLLRNSPP